MKKYDRDGNCVLYIESQEYLGDYEIVIVLLAKGHRCGYVGVNKENSLFGQDYNDLPICNFNVHGGITYSDFNSLFDESKKIWYIGFDCAHLFDANDYESIRRYGMETRLTKYLEELDKLYPVDSEVRTFDYVNNECKYLLQQIKMVNEAEE